jgi:hypothetical protein
MVPIQLGPVSVTRMSSQIPQLQTLLTRLWNVVLKLTASGPGLAMHDLIRQG